MYGSTRQVRSGQPIAIAAYPPIAGLGQAVQLTWRIDPDPSFRRWRVAVVSEDAAWERAFEEDLPGRRIQQQRVTPDVPGRYTAVLLVAVETGTARVTRTTFCVVGGDVTCAP
jgi:hypothetical protein